MTVTLMCKRLSHVASESFDKYTGIIIVEMELPYGRHVSVFSFFVCLFGFQNSMLISIVTGLVSTPARSG